MSDDEHEEPSPVTAFLAPLELGQHRAVMKRLGSTWGCTWGCTSLGTARGEGHLGLHSIKCVPY